MLELFLCLEGGECMDQQHQHSADESWVCLGTCQAVISQQEYDGGLTKCGAEVCTLKGQPFVKGKKDEATGKNVATE